METEIPKSIEEMFKVLCDSMNKVNNSTLELQNEVKEMKESIKANYDDLTGKLDALVGQQKSTDTELIQVKQRVKDLEKTHQDLQANRETKEENERRQLNVIIKGLAEEPGENIHSVMESLFVKMKGSFSYSLTNGASRMGPVPKVPQAQVALVTRSQRGQQGGQQKNNSVMYGCLIGVVWCPLVRNSEGTLDTMISQ